MTPAFCVDREKAVREQKTGDAHALCDLIGNRRLVRLTDFAAEVGDSIDPARKNSNEEWEGRSDALARLHGRLPDEGGANTRIGTPSTTRTNSCYSSH